MALCSKPHFLHSLQGQYKEMCRAVITGGAISPTLSLWDLFDTGEIG